MTETTTRDASASPDDSTGSPRLARATRLARLAKFVATTLAALVGVAKALGWL